MTLPRGIILNARTQIKKLRRLAKDIEVIEGRHFVCDILEDIWYCLRDAKTAMSELTALVNEIKSGRYEYGYTLLGVALAACVEEIGLYLFEQLKHYSLYLPNGTLTYHYCTIADPNFHDVLLIQTHALS